MLNNPILSSLFIVAHSRKLVAHLLIIVVISSIVGCNYDIKKIDSKEYIEDILKERTIKEVELLDTTKSRFNAEEIAHFSEKGLQYFPPDPLYFVDTKIIVDTSNPVFQMPTTTDRKPNYRIYGFLEFKLKDTICKLVAYQNMDYKDHPEYGGMLFIPFKDNTNEFTTYGGGRYIDVKIPESEVFKLDFNVAYNPYCAYSDRWSCPLVPLNNTLEVAVFAGEKAYK